MLRLGSNKLIRQVACNIQKMPATKKAVVGRMFSVQDSLPRLPVPPLDQTLQKYLKTVKPLLTEEEFHNTQQIVEEFHQDHGPKLQALLQKRAETETNWLSDWWTNTAYLEFRQPVIVNVSPGVVFPKQSFTNKDGQLKYTAKLIAGVLDYKMMIDNQTLPVDRMGKQPLCMMQYYKILSACRIPGAKRDSWVCYPPDEPNAPRHITVIHNNTFFSLDVYGSNKKPLSVEQLYMQLKAIIEMSGQPDMPVGILTSTNRNKWYKSYSKLIKDKTNKASIDDIQKSILVIAIDNKSPDAETVAEEGSIAARLMIHGGGSKMNSGNRWFDKTLQFVVGKNGISGLNYEHTTAEGPPIISIMDHVLDFCKQNKDCWPAAPGMVPPRKLTFKINDSIEHDIAEALQEIDSTVNDLDLNVFTFDDYGKNFPKSQKLSPDSFIQTAFQLTYYRMYGEPCATYETASLRQFQLGRTDTIRSCSIASLEFSKAMQDPSLSNVQKADLLRKAVAAHKDYTNEAIKGNGIDRHLLGLKLTALNNNMKVPKLHMDVAYTLSVHFKMSTSQVPAKNAAVLVFGPVVPDGYGICYNPQETQILFGVSAFNCCPGTDSKKYIDNLKQSFKDMREVLGNNVQAKL